MRIASAITVIVPLTIASGVCAALGPSPALAAQCSISDASLEFGPVDTLSSLGTAASADMAITCDQVSEAAEVVTICASLGPGSGGASDGVRRLAQGSDGLQYGLYADPGHGQPWGHFADSTLGAPLRLTLPVAGEQAAATVSVYGLVYGSQATVPPGQYLSTLSGGDVVMLYEEGDVLDCSGGQSTGASLMVAAQVIPNCRIVAGDLDFGNTGVIDRNLDASATVAVTCTPGTDFDISLNGGIAGAASPEQRIMRSGSDTVTYGLYLDQAREQPWGDGQLVKSGEGLGQEEIHTVYGRVPPQQAPAGDYSDTVIVTIVYN
jgi:spore coat protein U-like protein